VRRNPHTEAEEPADAIIEPIAVEALNERLHATSVTPELDDAPPAAMHERRRSAPDEPASTARSDHLAGVQLPLWVGKQADYVPRRAGEAHRTGQDADGRTSAHRPSTPYRRPIG
jgi:hypothetical protein